MKKKLLLGLAALFVSTSASVALIHAWSSPFIETVAATSSDSHQVDGYLHSIGLNGWESNWTFGNWNQSSSKFVSTVYLNTDDYFGLRVGGQWVGYSKLAGDTDKFTNIDDQIHPNTAGYYTFSFDETVANVTYLSGLTPEVAHPARSVANGTVRYWYTSDSEYVWGSNARFGIFLVDGGEYAGNTYLCDYVNNNGASTGFDKQALYYFDIPSSVTRVILLRLNPTPANGKYSIWNQSYVVELSNTGWTSPYKMNWLSLDNGELKASEGSYSGATPASLAAILQEFPTCTITASQIETIYDTFIKDHSGDLANATLAADFVRADYINEGETYVGLTQKNSVQPTVKEKWEAMCGVVGASPETGRVPALLSSVSFTSSSDLNVPLIVLSFVGIASATAFVSFLRKKKEQ